MIDVRSGRGATVTLKPTTDLDWIGAVSLRHVVEDTLHPQVQFVVDLEQVRHIDAVGISALIGSLRRARAVGGGLRVVRPKPAVERALQLVGVYGHLSQVAAIDGNDAA
jgi:anti-sigma B factor antagonist